MSTVRVRKTYKLLLNGELARTESGRSYEPHAVLSTDSGDARVNVPRASRKDLREAVRAARAAQAGWAAKTAYNRGQVLYRVAEMLEARRDQFGALLGGGRRAFREVDAAIDAWVWYAGWCDKHAQVTGTVNPVAGPYFTFTLPEPSGVVGIVAPESPGLLSLSRHLAAVLCSGNAAVVLCSEGDPLPGLVLGEVLQTSDVPKGVVNLLSGLRGELLPWLASHMDVNAVDATGCDRAQLTQVRTLAADNVKRVVVLSAADELSPHAVTAFTEAKTVWHPVGV